MDIPIDVIFYERKFGSSSPLFLRKTYNINFLVSFKIP